MMLKTLVLLSCLLALCLTVQGQNVDVGSLTELQLLQLQESLGAGSTVTQDNLSISSISDDSTFMQRLRNIVGPIRKAVTGLIRRMTTFLVPAETMTTTRNGRMIFNPDLDKFITQMVTSSSPEINFLKILLKIISEVFLADEIGRSNPVVPHGIINFLSKSTRKTKVDFSNVTFQWPHAILNFWNTYMVTKFPNDLYKPQKLPWWRLILGTNDHLPDRTVIGSWVYLSFLILFCGVSVIAGLAPIAGIYSEVEEVTVEPMEMNFELTSAMAMSRIDFNRYDDYATDYLGRPRIASKKQSIVIRHPVRRVKDQNFNWHNYIRDRIFFSKHDMTIHDSHMNQRNDPRTKHGTSYSQRFIPFKRIRD